jgi:uncharacterized protein YegL
MIVNTARILLFLLIGALSWDLVRGTVSGTKSLSETDIQCGGKVNITITLDSELDIAGSPASICLALDRSGSMLNALADLKLAANTFVDLLDEQTDGALDNTIGHGSNIGIVSFASTATVNVNLTPDASLLEAAIDALVASGETNHRAAIQQCAAMLNSSPNPKKVMIIFTDGQTTVGGSANNDALNAQAAGIEIFAIGLGAVSQTSLNIWATDPDNEHVFIAPSSADLESIFSGIGAAITVPNTDIVVTDTVHSYFVITGTSSIKGHTVVGENTVTWSIDSLTTETAILVVIVEHDCTKGGGNLVVNEAITYSDASGNPIIIPSGQSVNVRGCVANVDISPPHADAIVGETLSYAITVTDDFGDGIAGVEVSTEITGTVSSIDGEPSNPTPPNFLSTTDGEGKAVIEFTNTEASEVTITATATTDCGSAEANATGSFDPITALIDIKPGSDPNSFGANSQGNIPVALLGSEDFDVTQVDDSTVWFGDAPLAFGDAQDNSGHLEDVNNDGYMDKVYHFKFTETNLDQSDTEGCLSGEINGLDFRGCDSVNIVGGRN